MNPRSPGARWLRTLGLDANPLGAAVLATLIATLVLSALVAWPMLRARSDAPVEPVAARDSAMAMEAFDDGLSRQVAQIDGRSLFAIPPKPNEVPQGPAPKIYGGPQLIAFVNGSAWFADGQKISAEAPKGTSLELVRADPPWSIRVKWQGGEFDVELFKKVPLASLNDTTKANTNLWTTTSPTPGRNGGRGNGPRAADGGAAPPAGQTFTIPPEIASRRNESGPSMPGPGAIPPSGGAMPPPAPPAPPMPGPSGEPQRTGGPSQGGGSDTPSPNGAPGGAPSPAPNPAPAEPAPGGEPVPAQGEPHPSPNGPSNPPPEPSEP